MSVEDAIRTLTAAGATVTMPRPEARSLTLRAVGERLGLSVGWVREHLEEFPNAWRLPGGGQNGGEVRIPVRDLEALERRRRVAA